MSTIISGNAVAYTATQLISANANIIIRTPTAASADDFAMTATDLITAFIGTIDAQYDGSSFSVTIQNDSAFVITQTSTGTDVTLGPDTSVVIPAFASATFTFIQEDASVPSVSVEIVNSRALYAPTSSTDNAIVRYDGTSGNVTQDGVVTISDTGAIAQAISLALNGSTSGTLTFLPAAITTSYTLTLPPDDGLLGQVLSTNGSGVTSWVSNTSPDSRFYAFGPAAAATLSATFTTVNVVNSITGANYANASGVVTITAAGTYEFAYTAQFQSLDQTGGQTGSFAGRLLLDAGVVGGSITECFIQEVNGNLHRPSCSKSLYAVVTAGQTIALQVARTAGTTTGQTRVNQCTLTITQVA
jgi:hypothetical protein